MGGRRTEKVDVTCTTTTPLGHMGGWGSMHAGRESEVSAPRLSGKSVLGLSQWILPSECGNVAPCVCERTLAAAADGFFAGRSSLGGDIFKVD